MKEIYKPLILDVIKFFIVYSIIFAAVSKLTEFVPRSWDPTGVGMLALIVLVIVFIIASYRIGASYSDKLTIQQPGSLWNIFKRPMRSAKYGMISLVLCFLLFYLVVVVSSYLENT